MRRLFDNSFRMNIQFFASNGENGGDSGGGDDKDTKDETDYKALFEKEKADRAKDKATFDKTASDLAATKKALQAHETEVQKLAREAAEKNEAEAKAKADLETELAILKREKRDATLTASLKGIADDKEIAKLILLADEPEKLFTEFARLLKIATEKQADERDRRNSQRPPDSKDVSNGSKPKTAILQTEKSKAILDKYK